ncbi:MAG: GAF domain-containing protein [Actinomycetota bacterium]|nr:GAF domain-containing protein [Actinomycetota bacterium]
MADAHQAVAFSGPALAGVALLVLGLLVLFAAVFAVLRTGRRRAGSRAELREPADGARRADERAALLRATEAVTGDVGRDAAAQRLVDAAARLLRAEAADCYLREDERGMLRCAAVHGLAADLVGLRVRSDGGLAGSAIAQGRAVAGTDGRAGHLPHPAYSGFTAAVVAPIMSAGTPCGVLGVATADRTRAFTEHDAELLQILANTGSLAIRSAERRERSEQQKHVERGFFRIASALGQPLSRSATFDAVAEAATETLRGAFAAVLLFPSGGARLAGKHELPSAFGQWLDESLRTRPGVLESAARGDRLLAARQLETDERFDGDFRAVAAEAGCRALLAVPINRGDGEAPALVVVGFTEGRTFSEHEVELADHLARAARGAIERSELFERERASRSLAQQLAETGTVLARELDPAAVLDEVVERGPRLVDADACSLRVLEGDELVVAAAQGEGAIETAGERTPSTTWLFGDIVHSRTPVALADVRADTRLAHADAILARHAAYLGVPLLGSEASLQGVLSVYAVEPRNWRDEEVEALQALAATASAALASAELYQRVALEKERSFAILTNVADGIVAVDRDGHVVLWNAAAEQITGVPADEALGRRPEQVLERGLESGDEAAPGDRVVSIRRGDEEVWLSLTEAVMRDPAGLVSGRIFAFRDISADRLVEQMKSDFVSTVSHELRTPLTSIYGFAETLLRQDVLFGEEERAVFLGYIASESARLTEIVDDLLNVARLDTDDLQVQVGPTDIGAVVADVVAGARQAPLNGHRFVVELPDEPLAAAADSEKVRQIVSKLVDNAVKYSPSGGTVTVAARRKSDRVEVRVDDEGIGIPYGEQERIFRKFYRAESVVGSRGFGGIGLGLFIARELVAKMGGRISVTSSEGRGSSFAFELPLSVPAAVAERE